MIALVIASNASYEAIQLFHGSGLLCWRSQ